MTLPTGFSIGHTDLYQAGYFAAEAQRLLGRAREVRNGDNVRTNDVEAEVARWASRALAAKRMSIRWIKLARAEAALDAKYVIHDAKLAELRRWTRADKIEVA